MPKLLNKSSDKDQISPSKSSNSEQEPDLKKRDRKRDSKLERCLKHVAVSIDSVNMTGEQLKSENRKIAQRNRKRLESFRNISTQK